MRKALIPFVAFALVVVMFPLKTRKADELTMGTTPEYSLGEIEGYRSERIDGESSLKKLMAKSVDIRKYTDDSGRSFVATVVIGGEQLSSIHRPELCLTSQKFVISNARMISIAGTDWRCEDILHSGNGGSTIAYRFFNHEGFSTASYGVYHLRHVCDRAFRRQIDRWAFISVTALEVDDAALAEFIMRLAKNAAR